MLECKTRENFKMNLRDFEYFSFGRCALIYISSKKFNVSQPSISYAVKGLEEYYGCNLVKKKFSSSFGSFNQRRTNSKEPAEEYLERI